jgi:hypothetical protein
MAHKIWFRIGDQIFSGIIRIQDLRESERIGVVKGDDESPGRNKGTLNVGAPARIQRLKIRDSAIGLKLYVPLLSSDSSECAPQSE